MKKLHLLASILAAGVLAVPAVASAVDYGGVGGRPAHPQADNPRTQSIFIYTLNPGQETEDGVEVFNSTPDPQVVSIYPVDSVLSSDGAFACAQAVDAKTDVGSWIMLEHSTVALDPNSSQEVPFKVTVPNNVGVGEHDGCIAIQALSKDGQAANGGVTLSFRSAIRVAVTIPGTIVKKLDLTDVAVGGLSKDTYKVTPSVKNGGNVSLDTTVQVKLVPLLGATTVSTKGVYPVLPHSDASWNFELKRPFWGGLYRADVTAAYDGNTSAGIGQQKSSDTLTKQRYSRIFFAMPAPLAAAAELAVLVAIIVSVMWFVVGRTKATRTRKRWQTYTLDSGDTIKSLGEDFHVSWKKIAKVNNLKPPYDLHAKQKLKLPPTEE